MANQFFSEFCQAVCAVLIGPQTGIDQSYVRAMGGRVVSITNDTANENGYTALVELDSEIAQQDLIVWGGLGGYVASGVSAGPWWSWQWVSTTQIRVFWNFTEDTIASETVMSVVVGRLLGGQESLIDQVVVEPDV